MHSITLTDVVKKNRIEIILNNLTKEEFQEKVKNHFNVTDFTLLEIESTHNIPSILYNPESAETLLADNFWTWIKLDEYDQKLLAHYMEFTQDPNKELSEAKVFREKRYSFINRK